jgi:SAM-dependent methyltransferase
MAAVCSPRVPSTAEVFDAHAAQYEASLDEGLRLSGEGAKYFAEKRIAWTRHVLSCESIAGVLDFGCGVGLAAPLFREHFSPTEFWGFDPSRSAIACAERDAGDDRVTYTADARTLPSNRFDLAYCNGVFHHIAAADRPAALAVLYNSLRPGGWFALWENNPWNPGTRLVMRRIPFDRDAVTLSPPAARRMVEGAGFTFVRRDAWFLFPRQLSRLRPLEAWFHRLPLGAQYLTLCQKPAGGQQVG